MHFRMIQRAKKEVYGHFLEFGLLDRLDIAWIGLKMHIPIDRMDTLVLIAQGCHNGWKGWNGWNAGKAGKAGISYLLEELVRAGWNLIPYFVLSPLFNYMNYCFFFSSGASQSSEIENFLHFEASQNSEIKNFLQPW